MLCLPPPAVITHPRQSLPIPGPPLRSPSFWLTCSRPSFQIPTVPVPPAVFAFTLPSSVAPYSPLRNPGHPPIFPAPCLNSHIFLTILRKAQCAGPVCPNLEQQSPWCFALDRTTASCPVLWCPAPPSWHHPHRLCGAPGRFVTQVELVYFRIYCYWCWSLDWHGFL